MKSKAGSRGGIQKKRAGPTKIDGDGDLDMDSAAARRTAKSAAARPSTSGQAKPATRPSTVKNPRGASKAAQNVLKHLTSGTSGELVSQVNTRGRGKMGGLSYLRVYGLKQSKASSNPDGGVADLLSFLERKASAFTTGRQKRQVMIKKVCFYIDHVSGRIEFQQVHRIAACPARRSAKDVNISAPCNLHQLYAPELTPNADYLLT